MWHLSILTVALGVFAGLCYAVLSWNLYRHHDDELAHQADELVQALGAVPLMGPEMRAAISRTPVGTRVVMIRNRRGELLYRDPVLVSSEPNIGQQELLVHAAAINPRSPVFFTIDLERFVAVRFICVPLLTATFRLAIR